jgi:hypothetical protein
MERGGCSERHGAGPADPRADQENLASYANGVLAGALPQTQGLGIVRACLVADDGVSEPGGSGAGSAAGDHEGAKGGVHGGLLEVDVAFATPILDTLVARVTCGHRVGEWD